MVDWPAKEEQDKMLEVHGEGVATLAVNIFKNVPPSAQVGLGQDTITAACITAAAIVYAKHLELIVRKSS